MRPPRATTRGRTLAVDFGLVSIRRVNNDCVAVDLNLCLRKLQFHEFPTAFSKSLRAREDRRAIGPAFLPVVDRDRFFRNQPLQRRAIIAEPRLPNCFARGEYSFTNLRRQIHRPRHLLRTPLGIDNSVRSDLNPTSFALGVNIHDAEASQRDRRVAVFSLELTKEVGDGELRAVELHVEIEHFVSRSRGKVRTRLRFVCRSGPLDAIRAHVVVNAFDRRARTFQESAPVFRVRREDLVFVAVDERLKDTLNMRANRRRISRAIV